MGANTDLSRPDASPAAPAEPAEHPPRQLPLLWRVFAANAAVFALAFAVLALAPVTVHASVRLDELVILLVGLVVMLIADLWLVRRAVEPVARLARVMATVDLLRRGRRAVGFERSSREVAALADAFNEMLERLEAERRDSSARVLSAQENERLRIARELHDEIGQTLTAVALRAEHAAQRSEDQQSEFGQLAEIVERSLADVRRISLELRPGPLEELGLLNALISLCARMDAGTSVSVHRQLDGPIPQLSPDTELTIYRIAQEALTNAIRHASATDVFVSVASTDDELELSVRDNGKGISEPMTEGGGLTGMRERSMLIGADLRIGSALGAGVEVVLRVPLKGR